MFILKNEVEFDMAHYLSGYEGKCHNIHGHRYRLVTKVSAQTLHTEGQLRGMVDDFSNIKVVLKTIHDLFDHKLVLEDNEEGRLVAKQLEGTGQGFDIYFVPYRPTAEEMSRDIYHRMKALGIDVYEVELYETPTNSCIYTEAR
ncbi:MAG TPA: 6-carboxytetrahydropterin synthase QueD [Firmicutes bacterium]|nr:6-carboxytetrahydropterin synthase QueD [Bacillota bacterium]